MTAMNTYQVNSITANGGGKHINVTLEAADRKQALVRAKMVWIEANGYLPARGLRFNIEKVSGN